MWRDDNAPERPGAEQVLEEGVVKQHDGVMTSFCFRPYRRDDFDALVTLYQGSKGDEFCLEAGFPQCFPVIPLPCDELRLKAFAESETLVMEDKEGMAGAIYWRAGHIVGLLVDPRSRGRGIGRALVRAALARMGPWVTLDVVASNAPAIRLYESLHFEEASQRVGFYQGVPVTLLRMQHNSADRG